MARPILMWYGFLGGAGAWALQLVLGDGLEESACSQGSPDTQAWIVALTLLLGAVALGSSGAAFLTWRWADRRGDERGAVSFLALTGMFAGVFFLILIALGGLQLLALDSCRQG
jgi:hypothetical protein